nr:T9SS type A sorting domain-containing protein [Saprospiraceae bacterium]
MSTVQLTKALVLFFVFSLAWGNLFGQMDVQRCGADNFFLEGIEYNPQLADKPSGNQEKLRSFLMDNPHSIQRSILTIPVVVHVVYHTEEQNISDLQIYDQLEILNRSFNQKNLNLHSVPSHFRHLISDVNIEFCLAQKDPQGNKTNGINRIQTEVPEIGSTRFEGNKVAVFFSDQGGRDLWNPKNYLNLWICDIGGNLAGSSTFPNMAPYPEAEGILLDYRYVGSIGKAVESAPYDKGKTLVHEVGHYFNLFHPWGLGPGSCQNDDEVEDTPLQEKPYFRCQNEITQSCGSEDLIVNFMDYPEDKCLAMFTHGQKERMIGSIMLFREELISSDACNPMVGPEEQDISGLQIQYLNGAGQIAIFSQGGKRYELTAEIYDLLGKKLHTEKPVFYRSHLINSSRLSVGMYIVCLEDEKTRVCKKILVY